MTILSQALEAHYTKLQGQGLGATLVTVVHSQGSTPRKAGAKMLVGEDGRAFGTVGGGTVEHRVIAQAQTLAKQGGTQLLKIQLSHDLGMCCGGEMTFFMEALGNASKLVLFGLGHVGQAIAKAAQDLDMSLWLVDDLEENLDRAKAALDAEATTIGSYEVGDFDALPFGAQTLVVIATREHAIDQKLLEYCLTKEYGYLGVIGSRRKALKQVQRLQAKGFDEARIATVHCPMGIAIGAQTPAEIAVSVVAELIQARSTLLAAQPNRATGLPAQSPQALQ